MRVLLINPPRENEIIGNNPAVIEEERGHNPPLGLLYVAAYLLEHTSYEVSVIDSQVDELSYAALSECIRAARPDVVGLTAMTLTLVDVMKTVGLAKRAAPGVAVVLGGPHASLYPEETARLPEVDYVVQGEGEETFKDLLDAIGDPARLRAVPGLAFVAGEDVVDTGVRPPIDDLDRLPFPARHLVPWQRYSSLLARRMPVTTVFTSRGCPFACSFCDRPHLGKKFRARSCVNVVDELEVCTKMGIQDFLIYDDTFTVDRKRVLDICDEILRRRLDIGFDIRARVDTIHDEMLAKLRAAGCRGIHYGVEAGTDRVIGVLNKGIRLEQVDKVFRLTRKHRIPVLAYFMIGNPSETLEEIRTTFRVMRKLRPDYVHLTILTPFPGTKIYRDGLASGIIERDGWREFARDPAAGFVPPHWGETFSRAQLDELLAEGYRSFYMRPIYVARRLLGTRSWAGLKRQAAAGWKVLFMSQGSGTNAANA